MSSPDPPGLAFDLFISYAHADDRGEDHRKVSALVEAIKADYERVAGVPLRVFFDVGEIRTMDDWEARILLGLRQSKMLVAVLSPAYFRSDYCRKEWETYVETELAHALPGDGIAPIYVVRHPDFESESVEDRLRHWVRDLKRRQYIDWLDFWPEGAAALGRADVRRRLDALPGQIAERLRRAEVRGRSPHTVPMPSPHFVGRRDEMHKLRLGLLDGHIGAITAVHGIPGIGKSMLAFAYAWGYGYEYPGGRFLIDAANLSDLAAGMIALAEPMGVPLGDEERKRPDLALARVRKAFEGGPPALIVVDNLDDPALLSPQSRERALPRGDHVHVLVTTRVSPGDLPRIHCLPLDALDPPDALALLHGFRPIADSPRDDEWKAALEVVHRLGGHALAVEVAGVYLREHPEVSYRQFAATLEGEGVSLMEEEVGPEARGRLAWHAESCVARLLEPTLAALTPEEWRAVEYAAHLPPDTVPYPWLRELLLADFPDLARARLGDGVQTLFRRLERLRLVVPRAAERNPTPPTTANPGESRLARMHRLVQDVVRRRSGPDQEAERQEVVTRHASDRAKWLKVHWGQPGLAWELPALRDMALQMIDRDDRRGATLRDQISSLFQDVGRWLDVDVKTFQNRIAELLEERAVVDAVSYEYDPGYTVGLQQYDEDEERRYEDEERRERDYEAEERREREEWLENRVVVNPESAEYVRVISIIDELGNALANGDAAGARQHYEVSLAIAGQLAGSSPVGAKYARDISMIYNKRGDLARADGDAVGARLYYEGGLAIARWLSGSSRESVEYTRDLCVSYWKLANLLDETRDEEAAAWWRRAWETLDGMKRRGMFLSPGHEQVLNYLEDRFGFGR